MRVLALQLKRIGDLILTIPALGLLKQAHPEARITVAAYGSAAGLLPAMPGISAGIVFGPGRGWTPWQQVLTGPWDAVLDFTGTDRSALAVAMSRAPRRVTFDWVRKKKVRALAYNHFVASLVRDAHTIDHYADLLQPLQAGRAPDAEPRLTVPASAVAEAARALEEAGITGSFALIHPGTARPEKYWQAERWAEVIRHLRYDLGLACVLTAGNSPFELSHLAGITAASTALPLSSRGGGPAGHLASFAGTLDLLALAALTKKARLIISCDTAIVHLASAFRTPQITLFGPTNPFHWRPRHPGSIILSSASPEAPLTRFDARRKGAPMDQLSTELVIRATDSLFHLSAPLPAT